MEKIVCLYPFDFISYTDLNNGAIFLYRETGIYTKVTTSPHTYSHN